MTSRTKKVWRLHPCLLVNPIEIFPKVTLIFSRLMRGWYSWKIQKTFHLHPIWVDLFVFFVLKPFWLTTKTSWSASSPWRHFVSRIVHQHGGDDWTSCTWYGAGDLQKWWVSLHYTSLTTNYGYFSWSTIRLVFFGVCVCFCRLCK